jgi:copper resistance protein B
MAAKAELPLSLEVDLFELHLGKGADHLVLDSTLVAGDGADQFLCKVAGGSDTRARFDDLEIQGLYSRSLSSTIGFHAGIRHDLRAGSDLTHGVAGVVIELLPNAEVEHYFYLSEDGDLTGGAQLIASFEMMPRLALEPRLAVSWSSQRIPAEELGHGLTDLEVSVRLRQSFGEQANVYTGIVHERLLGSTRVIAVAADEASRVTRAIVGIGFNF